MSSSEFAGRSFAMVFLYGTLMRGECRHAAIASQTFLGEASTTADYRMFLVEDFPGLIEVAVGAGKSILGELWMVDLPTLQRLDKIEAVEDGLYERRAIQLATSPIAANQLQNAGQPMAWFYRPATSQLPDCGHDWRQRD